MAAALAAASVAGKPREGCPIAVMPLHRRSVPLGTGEGLSARSHHQSRRKAGRWPLHLTPPPWKSQGKAAVSPACLAATDSLFEGRGKPIALAAATKVGGGPGEGRRTLPRCRRHGKARGRPAHSPHTWPPPTCRLRDRGRPQRLQPSLKSEEDREEATAVNAATTGVAAQEPGEDRNAACATNRRPSDA